jgi:hypothetical protein
MAENGIIEIMKERWNTLENPTEDIHKFLQVVFYILN